MSRRRNVPVFAILFAITTALALGGALWLRLGTDGRAPATATGYDKAVLWLGPVMTLALWGLGAPIGRWLSAVSAQLEGSEGNGDAARGVVHYLGSFRAYMVGFTLLVIGLQAYALLSAAGVARPLGLDRESFTRLGVVLSGLLFISIGNVSARIPYIPNRWIDAPRNLKGNRFFGWVFVLGGIAYCVLGVVLPFDRLATVTFPIVLAMIVLPLLRFGVLTLESRRDGWDGGGRA